MTKISKDELLKNEKIEKVLSPHPLSFLKTAITLYIFDNMGNSCLVVG